MGNFWARPADKGCQTDLTVENKGCQTDPTLEAEKAMSLKAYSIKVTALLVKDREKFKKKEFAKRDTPGRLVRYKKNLSLRTWQDRTGFVGIPMSSPVVYYDGTRHVLAHIYGRTPGNPNRIAIYYGGEEAHHVSIDTVFIK